MRVDVRLESVFDERNIDLAIEHLSGKKDSYGIDGVKLSEIREYWRFNKDKIIDAVTSGKYEVGIVRQTDVLSVSKKRRTISTMNSIDRLLARALLQVTAPDVEKQLSNLCFA